MKGKLVKGGRTRSMFNTGTRSHKSLKDYTRKLKHKNKAAGKSEEQP